MNRQSFDTTKPNGRKQFLQLLNVLLDYNQDFENKDFNDIHIYQEESYIMIEWERTSIEDHEVGFKYLDYDESIYSEVRLPNDTYVNVPKGEEDATLKEWLEEHPEWQMTSYGTWTNTEENRVFNIENRIKENVEKEANSTIEICRDTPPGISQDSHNTNIVNFILHYEDKHRVIHRTDYIVVGSKMLEIFVHNDLITLDRSLDENKDICKIGVIDLRLEEQKFDRDVKTKYYDAQVHVYFSNDVKDEIMFFTDSHYMIYKLKIKDGCVGEISYE